MTKKNSDKFTIPHLHSNQWRILNNFRSAEKLHFNQMKNFDIDARNFVYHLQKLLDAGLLEYDKTRKQYILTKAGKLLFTYYESNESYPEISIDPFIGLYIERDRELLVVRRNRVPHLHRVGIPVFNLRKDQFIRKSAIESLNSLGLSEKLINPLILETMYKDKEGEVITHSNMYVFYVHNPKGTIPKSNEEGELLWMSPDELLSQKEGYEDSKTLVAFFKSHKNLRDITIVSKVDTKTGF